MYKNSLQKIYFFFKINIDLIEQFKKIDYLLLLYNYLF